MKLASKCSWHRVEYRSGVRITCRSLGERGEERGDEMREKFKTKQSKTRTETKLRRKTVKMVYILGATVTQSEKDTWLNNTQSARANCTNRSGGFKIFPGFSADLRCFVGSPSGLQNKSSLYSFFMVFRYRANHNSLRCKL